MIVDQGDTILVDGLSESGDMVHPAIVTKLTLLAPLGLSSSTFGNQYTQVDCTVFLARRPPMLLTELKVYLSKQAAQAELACQRESTPDNVEMVGWRK